MRLLPLLLLALTAAASAQPPEALPPPPMVATPEEPAPVQTPPAESEEVIEPQVTIVRRGEDVVEEYRIGGQRYMVKITPRFGYPYFLVDTDGDGSLETRRSELSNPPIPQWVLFRW